MTPAVVVPIPGQSRLLIEPKRYQLRGAHRIDKKGGYALLADEMGLGKTGQAYIYANWHPELRPIIVVTPKGLKLNWQDEAEKWLNWRTEILSGSKPPRPGLRPPSNILIINYDVLHKWLDYFRSINPKLIIADEVHYVKNRSARRTKALKELCRMPSVESVVALSGTPLTNQPAELWAILNILWPNEFPSFTAFGARYCEMKRRWWGIQYTGARRLDELHDKLHDLGMIRRRVDQVMQELPKMQHIVVPMELSSKKEYKEARDDLINWLRRNYGRGRANRAARAERMVKIGYLKRLVARLKFNSVCEWIDNYLQETDDKLIVFGIGKKFLNALNDEYHGQSLLVNGEVSSAKERKRRVDCFRRMDKYRLLFGNLDVLGNGHNITEAPAAAIAELGWAPGIHSQAFGRIRRIGQTRRTRGYFLIAKGTIEEWICERLHTKQKHISAVLDGDDYTNDLSIFDELTEKLLGGEL